MYIYIIHEYISYSSKDHDDNYVYETTDLPDELILSVSGDVLMNEKAARIGPIINCVVKVSLF